MKTPTLLVVAAFVLLFSQCKTTAPTASSGPAPSLLEVQQILDTTAGQFLQYADSTNGDPWRAIMLTANWVKLQPNVQSVATIDSTYLNIFLKSGLEADFFFDPVNDSGYSTFRGGGKKNGSPAHISFSNLSKNTITNKKVLIYAPAYTEFNLQSTVPTTISTLTNSGVGLDVTLLKDQECTPAIASTFPNYGFVILDTHGMSDAFMSGTLIGITKGNMTESQYKDAVVLQAGQDTYDRLLSKDFREVSSFKIAWVLPNWQKLKTLKRIESIYVTTQYIKTLPSMPNTMIFGNMCYSGAHDIKTAFMDKNPISYYSFAMDNGGSSIVTDNFSKDMEDSLSKRLVNDLDSTGIANLRPSDGAEFYDNYLDQALKLPPNEHKILLFKHFGADDYSYSGCMPFTDARDGQKYCSVKIGTQTWMAENLRYNAPGSLCYNDEPSNCTTYGRIYDWATLMQGAASSSANPSGVQGVCPKGWHVPSVAEYHQLVNFLGGDIIAGGKMKAVSPLWNQGENFGATNSSGFSALPSGSLLYPGGSAGKMWDGIGLLTVFSTTDDTTIAAQNDAADQLIIYISSQDVNFGSNFKIEGHSCRCVKDP